MFRKYAEKGKVGLVNNGNTCFVNSCLQILFQTHEFNLLLDNPSTAKKMNDKTETVMLQEYNSLRELVFSVTKETVVVSPTKFIHTIHTIAAKKGIELFIGFSQNDISEFLMFLVDCFHLSLSRKVTITVEGNITCEYDAVAKKCYDMMKEMYSKEWSEVLDIFHAIHVNIITEETSGEMIRSIPEPFFMINLPIVNPTQDQVSPTTEKVSLIQCFQWYVAAELLQEEFQKRDDDNDESNKVKAYKQILFWTLPTILVLDLKRFNSQNQKNQCLVTFPLIGLDLSAYVIGYDKEKYIYDCFGISNHSGSVSGGHYTCYAKNATGVWYYYNDTTVKKVEDENLDQMITAQVYCLFYRRVG